ncbi:MULTISPECIES: helix-turn-helix domain-containing protein [Rhizobium]|uniref:Helix-turn-helix transcriptional regulator n=1 Tax=Rhizobium rhododendri TaxID=2506430 RepID=A0ABY8INM5_9HYPH|nr:MULTISPECIES: helix-turn-helix transcriptional regulator [Rhizobium]MBZ5762967.1 helix-turn-helix domain-containing protein [Rhizobium sp. VS19-DR96]MBZ5768800.1 helix-turn-helix domain-containing protein [Rhizobium sp. VS19-DR129.2]MBZ5776416.1 helix-turn-helix domain-containing protein [Rhizobium sp. VS19-DRK62.2]MBZ5787623.1 helix-turn-helix domain-containing protein [Rhizobium sp. VS19-DR121]MBZ5804978.1 helix-turn-helix domain-containing protein [Rhizobium sp. VS19-DR181]
MTASSKQPDPVDIEVGRRIKLQRRIKGMSQTVLADGLFVTFQQVQKYEKGSNRVSASRMSNIARILEVPVSYFFEGNEQQPDHDDGDAISPLRDLTQFVATIEGSNLNRAFSSIRSSEIRKRIIGLVAALAKDHAED